MQEFGRDLMHNVLALHFELKNKTYIHGSYQHFKISDPKPIINGIGGVFVPFDKI